MKRSQHEHLKGVAREAIYNLHRDISVSSMITRDDLLELRDYINELVDAIDSAQE
jgi:hypothetical protein